jgi:signal transduction histidine kinase
LHIVFNTVHQLLGGQISFTSTLGQGTRFEMILPCQTWLAACRG